MNPRRARSQRFILWFLIGMLLVGCTNSPRMPLVEPTATLPVDASGLPDPRLTARAYLEAWRVESYADMYALLTSLSQDALSQEEFSEHYQGVAAEAALLGPGRGVDYELLSTFTEPETAQVSYRVTMHSELAGDFSRETVMNLKLEAGQWRVQWDDTLVLPELKGGNYLHMERGGYIPSRANIYDIEGHAIVAQMDVTAIGLYPDRIQPEQEAELFKAITELTGLNEARVRARYAEYPKGQDWYLPLGEVAASEIAAQWDRLSKLSALALNSYKARYHYGSGVAPHLMGYMGSIPAEDLDEYLRLGYAADEKVGREGLEKWGEPYLAGGRGGALYVVSAQGQPVTRLAEAKAQPSQAIYTTLDREFQTAAQQAMAGFRGAVVALEVNTGRVVALVSSPGFDPNAFEPVNFNSGSLLAEIAADPAQPLFNRATLGQYPLGSVFKIVTMAAALESGYYTPETSYYCGYTFDEIPGVTLYDWTYEHNQQNHVTGASGMLTLSGGLMRSCNPFFYHIGLDLFNKGMTTTVSSMARQFGLGSMTGIAGLPEEDGQVPDPENAIDATNTAIGQGALLVTPIQVADFIAAIANGGTLYVPQVVEKIAPPGSTPTQIFKPQVRGKLPVHPSTLRALQEAMVGVVQSTEPRGTAYHVFTGLNIPTAGKTGTATSGSGAPHAWYAGYTFANDPDHPDIAIAIIAENAGEGSMISAPIFRRLVEIYFRGTPGKLYPWEAEYYVTQTPAPATPAP